MHLKSTLLTLLAVAGISLSAQAGTITWGDATFSQLYFSNGSDFPTTSTGLRFEIGTFDTSSGFNVGSSSYTEWYSHWHPLDILTTSEYSSPQFLGGGDYFTGSFNLERTGSFITTTDNGGAPAYNFTPGDQFYYWIYDNTTMAPGNQWAVFTADTWQLPTDSDLSLYNAQFRILPTNGNLTALWGSVGTVTSATSEDLITLDQRTATNFAVQTATIAPIPEPASVLSIAAAGITLLLRRRRPLRI